MDELAMHMTEITSVCTRSADFCGVFRCGNEFDEIICKIYSSSKFFLFGVIKESSVGVEFFYRGKEQGIIMSVMNRGRETWGK